MSETPHKNFDQLKLLVAKLNKNHNFMAWILSTFQRIEFISDEQLISQLKTTPEMYVRLALCKCPNPEETTFATQIREISRYTNIDHVILANIIREVITLGSLSELSVKNEILYQKTNKLSAGLLAAARDKVENAEEKPMNTNNKHNDTGGGDNVAG